MEVGGVDDADGVGEGFGVAFGGCDEAVGESGLPDSAEEDSDGGGVEDGAGLDVEAFSAVEEDGGLGAVARASDLIDEESLDEGVFAVAEFDTVFGGFGVAVGVSGVSVENVGSDDEVGGLFDEEVVFVAHPEGVAEEGCASDAAEVDVDVDVAEDVVGDGVVALPDFGRVARLSGLSGLSEDADVGGARCGSSVLNGASDDGDLGDAEGSGSGVEEDVGGGRGFDFEFGGEVVVGSGGGSVGRGGGGGGDVVLDVAGGDLDVADVSAEDDDSAAAVVGDVASEDVGLVEVDAVVEDADAGVSVDVGVGKDEVSVAFDESYAVAEVAEEEFGEVEFHGSAAFDAVGLGVGSDDFDGLDGGGALVAPDFGLDGVGRRGSAVGSDDAECGSGAFHADGGGGAVAVDGEESGVGESDLDGADDSVGSAWESDESAGVDGALDGVGVVGDSVAPGSEVEDGAGLLGGSGLG